MRTKGIVYMMSTKDNTAIYTGVTSNLKLRYTQHLNKTFANSFTARYHCSKLLYYQEFPDIMSAIAEEKRIKGGSRKTKLALITALSPGWKDLGPGLMDLD